MRPAEHQVSNYPHVFGCTMTHPYVLRIFYHLHYPSVYLVIITSVRLQDLETGSRQRSWLIHYATSRKVAGSTPDRSLDFLINLTFPAPLWPCARLSLLTETSTRNLLGVKGRPARKADNLTAICEPIV
jgi:hypothetical protein